MEKAGKSPCKGCEERAPGCHAGCERYNAWAREHIQRKAAISKQLKMDKDIDEVLITGKRRRERKARIKR